MANFKRFTLRHSLIAATMLAGPLILAVPNYVHAQVVLGFSITVAPPLLPVYVQPPMPEEGYIWMPGYWAYGDEGYYWVPGTWVMPPDVGLYWTPPYWDWNDGVYVFNNGYWGPQVGYYGGVNYGYGYGGEGYEGGRWNGRHFEYNRAANNFGSVHVNNFYERNLTIVNHSNVSYHGGRGGLQFRPTQQDLMAQHERHIPVTADQERHISAAQSNPAFAYSHNNGRPAITATSRPAEFGGAVVHGQPENNAWQHPAGQNGAEHQPGQMNHQAPPPQQMYHQAPPAEQMNHQAPPAQQMYHQAPPAEQMYHQAPPPQQMYHQAPPPQQMYHQAPPAQQMYHQAPPAEQMYHQAPPAQQMYHQAPPAQQMSRPAGPPPQQEHAGPPPQHGNEQKKPQ